MSGFDHDPLGIFGRVAQLALPIGKYVVVGGAMEAHGIRHARDIDVVVSADLFSALEKQGWELCRCEVCRKSAEAGRDERVLKKPGADVQAFSWYSAGKDYKADVAALIADAEVIRGIPFVDLSELVKWKSASGRDKDLDDIALITAYLNDR